MKTYNEKSNLLGYINNFWEEKMKTKRWEMKLKRKPVKITVWSVKEKDTVSIVALRTKGCSNILAESVKAKDIRRDVAKPKKKNKINRNNLLIEIIQMRMRTSIKTK